MTTKYEQIANGAKARIKELQTLEFQLAHEINKVLDREWTRPLEDEDYQELDALFDAQASVVRSIREVSYITLGALDKTDELKRICNAMTRVVRDLRRTAAKINHIAEIAQKITEALGGVDKLGEKLSGLLPRPDNG